MITKHMMVSQRWLLILLAWFAFGGLAYAAPALPGESCKVKPNPQWSEPEKWIWTQICEGKTADLAKKYGGSDDPKQADQWPENRHLSPIFLQTILLYEPWRSSISNRGVEIIGAKFSEDIQLEEAHLNVSLYLRNSLIINVNMEDFETTKNVDMQKSHIGNINLFGASIGGQLVLDDTTVTGELNMDSVKINDSASIKRIHVKKLNLMYGYIGRQLTIEDSIIYDELNMNASIIKQDVLMDRSNLKRTTLSGADIGGLLKLTNATVNGELSMINISVKLDVLLTSGNFQDIVLTNANIGGHLNFDNATVNGKLSIGNASVKQNLSLMSGSFQEIVLANADIYGQLNLDNSKVTGSLNMQNVNITDSALIRRTQLKNVDLLYGYIGGQLTIEDSKVSDELNMNVSTIKKDVILSQSQFVYTTLSGANIGGLFKLYDINGNLLAYNTIVGRDIILIKTHLADAALRYIDVGGNIEIENGDFQKLDLTGSSFGHDLILGSKGKQPPRWNNDNVLSQQAQLILSNVSVNGIQDLEEREESCKTNGLTICRKDAWPRKMELDGFKFNNLGVIDVDNKYSDISKRPVEWWKKWLDRNQSFSPQPYQMVAGVLRKMGRADDADEVLYAGRNAEYDVTSCPGNLLLWFNFAMIGYGYKMFRSGIWIVVLVSVGVIILYLTGESSKVSAYPCPTGYPQRVSIRDVAIYWVDLVAYSFDILLPIIRLRDAHYAINLEGFARYYFYIHRLLGWVLGAFLVVGISGLTKLPA